MISISRIEQTECCWPKYTALKTSWVSQPGTHDIYSAVTVLQRLPSRVLPGRLNFVVKMLARLPSSRVGDFFRSKCQIQINQQALLCFVFICSTWINSRPTRTEELKSSDSTNKEVSNHKMSLLSGLKVMCNEHRRLQWKQPWRCFIFFCSPFFSFGDAERENSPPTKPSAPIGRFCTF